MLRSEIHTMAWPIRTGKGAMLTDMAWGVCHVQTPALPHPEHISSHCFWLCKCGQGFVPLSYSRETASLAWYLYWVRTLLRQPFVTSVRVKRAAHETWVKAARIATADPKDGQGLCGSDEEWRGMEAGSIAIPPTPLCYSSACSLI